MLITILLAFRCILSEKLLAKFIKINVNKDIILEIVLVVIFICTGWYMKSWYGLIIYLCAYLVYLYIKKKDILETIKLVKRSK